LLKRILCLCLPSLLLAGISSAQSLQKLVHQPPDGAGIGFLLTDGTALYQGNGESDWWKLTPDNTGSYVNGTWTKVGSLQSGYIPDAFASAVLADGRVVIVGGEYNNGSFVLTNMGAIYDPSTSSWTPLTPPSFWPWIGDSPAVVLPNGKFLVGNKLVRQGAELDPKTLTWTKVGYTGKADFNAEEGWTLMPDGNVLTNDVRDAPNSEIYNPTTQQWTSAGSTVVDLHSPNSGCLNYGGPHCYHPPGEVGPGILRPDGTVFATGAFPTGGTAGHTSVYSPVTKGWTPGPDFPNGDAAGDSFAALVPSGNVLVLGNSGQLYEYDGTNLTPTQFAPGSLMMLPTGQVLVGSAPVEVYNPAGTYNSSWAPTITTVPSTITHGMTYQISGTQFNGLSQAAAFGDEDETATNYPLVRITNSATKHVFYAKTHDHSTMGVATGSMIVSTNFDVPTTIETGASTLVVVANGIPSVAVNVTVN